jgi:hypothetical protein
MFDRTAVMLWVHRRNIERYGNMLKTNLTEGERRFVEELLAEEDAEMRRVQVAVQPGNKTLSAKEACHA